MSVLNTVVYTVETEEEARRFEAMTAGMAAAYSEQPGFERLIVARDVIDPLTIVTLSWWESAEAMNAWGGSEGYRDAKKDAGDGRIKVKVKLDRWEPLS